MNKLTKQIMLTLILTFFMVPLIFTMVGSFMTYHHYQKIFGGEYEQIEAVIHDIRCYRDRDGDNSCSTYIKYFVDGKEYKNILYPVYSTGDKVGNIKKVFYNKADPSLITTKSMIYIGIVIICVSLLFILFFFFKIKDILNKERIRRELFKTGKQVYVDVINIVIDHSISYNKKNVYMAECIYTDELGNVFEMYSESTLEALKEYFEEKNQNLKLKAYIDRNDVNKYVIPIDYLFD